MGIALAEPTLVRQVEQWGKKTDRPVENILEVAVQTYLDELEKEAIRAETKTFWAMHDELLKAYPGEYIALYLGRVVAHDKDVSRLEEGVREQFGLLPVLISAVLPEVQRDLHWRGGKLEGVATNI